MDQLNDNLYGIPYSGLLRSYMISLVSMKRIEYYPDRNDKPAFPPEPFTDEDEFET